MIHTEISRKVTQREKKKKERECNRKRKRKRNRKRKRKRKRERERGGMKLAVEQRESRVRHPSKCNGQ